MPSVTKALTIEYNGVRKYGMHSMPRKTIVKTIITLCIAMIITIVAQEFMPPQRGLEKMPWHITAAAVIGQTVLAMLPAVLISVIHLKIINSPKYVAPSHRFGSSKPFMVALLAFILQSLYFSTLSQTHNIIASPGYLMFVVNVLAAYRYTKAAYRDVYLPNGKHE